METKPPKRPVIHTCGKCGDLATAFSSLCVTCRSTLPPCRHCGSMECGEVGGCCLACAGSPRGSCHSD